MKSYVDVNLREYRATLRFCYFIHKSVATSKSMITSTNFCQYGPDYPDKDKSTPYKVVLSARSRYSDCPQLCRDTTSL